MEKTQRSGERHVGTGGPHESRARNDRHICPTSASRARSPRAWRDFARTNGRRPRLRGCLRGRSARRRRSAEASPAVRRRSRRSPPASPSRRPGRVVGAAERSVSAAFPRSILEQHREWLGSGGRAGRRASLNGAALAAGDLRGATLARADLKGADLSGADLEAADFANANLEGADLSGANLRRCNPQGCRLRGVKGLARAALHDVNLLGATGLDGTEFAGADLAGARIPESLSFEGRLSYVAETSQNVQVQGGV